MNGDNSVWDRSRSVMRMTRLGHVLVIPWHIEKIVGLKNTEFEVFFRILFDILR